jgi:serine/threonine protein kinase
MSGKQLPVERVGEIGEQVVRGLAYAHAQNVVHRDLTPSNVMITDSGKVKLMDFGLARSREVGHTITVTGVIQGTPGYMAPEQLTETLDARTDQYSFGVVLFEMLTGRRPIEKADAMQLIMATYTEDAPDPREFREDIPEPIAKFILKLLSRKPEDRFADLNEVQDAFWEAFSPGSE